MEPEQAQSRFRETITGMAQAEGRFIRQTGGRNLYGVTRLMVEPLERGQGLEFVNALESDALPQAYIQAIEEGVREIIQEGVLAKGVPAGYPIVDIRVTLLDGSHHETDSNPMTFKMAGAIGFKEAVRKARPIVIELDS
jgi:elongation factor G